MRIQLTNQATGRTRIAHARLTDRHAHCDQQPVLLIDGQPLEIANVVLQGMRVIEPPRRANQVRMFAQWQSNAQAILGARWR
jgi:hypothetical protein